MKALDEITSQNPLEVFCLSINMKNIIINERKIWLKKMN